MSCEKGSTEGKISGASGPRDAGAATGPSSRATPSPSTQDRVIRVFISSTFRDMTRERDLLVKRVFPELRRKCAKRFVTFTEVDLRWGITEEQSAEGQVLPLCLAEIERSRPYFLGLLGERYGWIPDTIRPEIIDRESWLKEHLHGGTSVTELEILHGVLNNPKMAGHAVFYFRDPAYAYDPSLSDEERRELGERNIPFDVKTVGEAEATRRTEERKAKLKTLKKRIRESNLPLVDPYATPESLAEAVHRQFDELIDRLYPEDQTPDPLTQERMGHETHAKNKLFGCIERPAHMKALTDYADRADMGGKGFVLTGESGGGKTALFAAWARDWAKANPEDWLFQHYFGATPESASSEGFLRRLMGELKGRFGITLEIPADPEKLRNALPLWLAMTPREVQIVLVLDGLNQVQDIEADRQLSFIPRQFPPHVTVLASTLPGPALDALCERGWIKYELPKATEAEADSMVAEYLRQIGRFVDVDGRPIDTPLRRQIVAAPSSRNPLFLRTVLEELRQFGSFEKLSTRVAYYLEARDPKDLFLRVIRRWQEDFDDKDIEGRDRDLVRRTLTHLWAARQGLFESEWLDLLGSQERLGQDDGKRAGAAAKPLPRSLWSPLFLALEPHLSQRTGLFVFGHDFLRQAVEQEWLSLSRSKRRAHLVIADYFERHPSHVEMTGRKATEWPFQLYASASWKRLEECLTNIPLFLALYNERTKWELTGYWHPLRKKPLRREMGACYTSAYNAWIEKTANSEDYLISYALGCFLRDNGIYATAKILVNKSLKRFEQVLGSEHEGAMSIAACLAGLLLSEGDFAGAQSLLERGLDTSERNVGRDHPSTLRYLNNLAKVLMDKGDYEGAQSLFERALNGTERVLGPNHPETMVNLNNLAGLMVRKGDYTNAKHLYERALATNERILGVDHPNTLGCLHNLATIFLLEGDYDNAKIRLERTFENCKRVLGPEHPDTLRSMLSLSSLLLEKGDYTNAHPLCERAFIINERLLGPEHPDTLYSLMVYANVFVSKGDYINAQTLFERALKAYERLIGPGHPDTLNCLEALADVLARKGDIACALPLYKRVLSGLELMLGPDNPITLSRVDNLADLLVNKGDLDEAKTLYERVLKERERVLGSEHPDTLVSVNNLANVMKLKGDLAGALPLHEKIRKQTKEV